MLKRILLALVALAGLSAPAFAASSYTPCYAFENPTPGDPATSNVWGTIENTGRTLADAALGSTVSLDVSGASNVTLTASNGAADQSRGAHYIFTGTLTGNVIVLFPASPRCGAFTARNNTTGAFTLSIGTSNGAGGAAGNTVAILQSGTAALVNDGTNIFAGVNRVGIQAAAIGANSDITSLLGLTTPLAISEGGTGNTTGTPAGTAGGDLGGSYPNPQVGSVAHVTAGVLLTTHGGTGNATGQPSGTAGGALNGSYPNPSIAAGGVGPTQIANGAVGPTQLANTAVSAGSYNTANITVDAQGRLTAASNSVRGAQIFTSSGTFTAPAGTTSNTVFKFTITGGGGAGTNTPSGGGAGATCIAYPSGITGSQTIAITVGNGGAGTNGGDSSAVVGATTYTGGGGVKTGSAGGSATCPGGLAIPGGTGSASNGPAGAGDSMWGGPGSGSGNGAYGAGGWNASGLNGTQGVVLVEWW